MNRRKVKRVELKVGTLHVGMMMGKNRVLSYVMERRKCGNCPGLKLISHTMKL